MIGLALVVGFLMLLAVLLGYFLRGLSMVPPPEEDEYP